MVKKTNCGPEANCSRVAIIHPINLLHLPLLNFPSGSEIHWRQYFLEDSCLEFVWEVNPHGTMDRLWYTWECVNPDLVTKTNLLSHWEKCWHQTDSTPESCLTRGDTFLISGLSAGEVGSGAQCLTISACYSAALTGNILSRCLVNCWGWIVA